MVINTGFSTKPVMQNHFYFFTCLSFEMENWDTESKTHYTHLEIKDSPLDIIRVPSVMPLHLLLHVVQHHHSSGEVHDLTRRQVIQVTSAVSPTIAVSEGPMKEKCCCARGDNPDRT